jgi:sulfoxide reductase heme-binding subunit YedZ
MGANRSLSGWPIVGVAALAVALMTAVILVSTGASEEGFHLLLRATALTSLILFLSAFVAAPLRQLYPTRAFAWMRRNRRYLGVSFAVSHAVHLAAILTLVRVSETFADQLEASTVIGGGLAYAFIAAMTATSFDRTAAWLGPRRWKILHTTGVYYLWVIFFVTYLPRAARSFVYVAIVGVLAAAMALRILRRLGPTRRTRGEVAPGTDRLAVATSAPSARAEER